MSKENNEQECCPICYETFIDKCVTPCQHAFCEKCICRVFLNGNNLCPYCRAEVTPFTIKLTTSGKPLLPIPTTIFGCIYIQGNTKGLASYHFDSEDDCYISYASSDCNMWPSLSDGSRPPVKKSFKNTSFNENTRTFCGEIHWSPIHWEGDMLWKYTMVFSEDFLKIPFGTVIAFKDSDETIHTKTSHFGYDLNYERLLVDDLCST